MRCQIRDRRNVRCDRPGRAVFIPMPDAIEGVRLHLCYGHARDLDAIPTTNGAAK